MVLVRLRANSCNVALRAYSSDTFSGIGSWPSDAGGAVDDVTFVPVLEEWLEQNHRSTVRPLYASTLAGVSRYGGTCQ